MKRKLTALMLSGAMLCALSLPASAAGPELCGLPPVTPKPISQEIQTAPASVLYYGRVTHIQKDEQGEITRLVMESERYGTYIMNIYPDTVWIDSGNCTADDPSDLAEGEGLYVFHSSVTTRSMPPQTTAFAVVRNIPMDAGCAMYHVVEGTEKLEDGSLRIVTDNGGLCLTVNGETELSDYAASQKGIALDMALDDLAVDTPFMAWYSAVRTSYPARADAFHLMLLPTAKEEPALPQEGAELTMELDGKVPNMVGRYENGTAMVPVAAVARALGLEANYTRDCEGSIVTVESDQFRVRMNIGLGLVNGSTKIPGAVGATGPLNYGKAPYIVEPGTTWAPAEIFNMLGRTVTLEGTNLIIK